MIGIVIVTHGQLGEALIEAASFILGSLPESVLAVSININEPVDTLRAKITDGIKQVDRKKGILILTDMFGGSPSNLSYSFLEEGRVDVLTGVNLPLVIKAVDARSQMELGKLGKYLEEFGKKSISLASGILRGNKRS
ncbi:MAG: PTS fructose transporter subunit IIA [Desulfobacterales bacterium CG07_land_8_20_14_0_80_52_14]|nr:MAG: PTS fructose transporter subunit IIA [Desulfobacterales bacterium CG23_combo_of_CG06-09_8_20_14_all_52_9]PIU49405.1 MAG: PTS fructose transporter subunit IIA [Desulfobacterales bacterium CG07_land_8_20_14_0_80_52_14]